MPDMVSVDSSNIDAIGYEQATRELYVRFLSGGTYIYSEVPVECFEELLRAPSKGSYLNRAIKSAYTYRHL